MDSRGFRHGLIFCKCTIKDESEYSLTYNFIEKDIW